MSEISPRRSRIGRWTLAAGAALALPLTATVVYAGQDASEAPVAPTPPAVPAAPEASHPNKHIEIVTHHAGHDGGAHEMFERRFEKNGKTIVIRSDTPIGEAELEAQLSHLDSLRDIDIVAPTPPVPPVPPVPGVAPAASAQVRRIIMHGDGHDPTATAMMGEHCKSGPTWADADVSREGSNGGKKALTRTRVLLCGTAGEAKAAALAGVRNARANIAASASMSEDVRRQVLEQLDHTIADMEKDAG